MYSSACVASVKRPSLKDRWTEVRNQEASWFLVWARIQDLEGGGRQTRSLIVFHNDSPAASRSCPQPSELFPMRGHISARPLPHSTFTFTDPLNMALKSAPCLGKPFDLHSWSGREDSLASTTLREGKYAGLLWLSLPADSL